MIDASNISQTTMALPTAAANSEPPKPSQDFFGLTDGAIGCRPKSAPTR